VPATLPQLLRRRYLQAPPPVGSPLANPQNPLQPRAQPLQPATRNIIHAQPAFASTHSQRSWPPMHAGVQLRSSDVSCVIRRRLGASDAAPSSRISLPASTAAPRLVPRKPPPHAAAPRANRPGLQHAISSMHSRRSHTHAHSTAQLAADARRRTIEVQRRQLRHPSETRCQRRCPIISDLIACTQRRTSARRSQAPRTRYSPARNHLSPQHATSSMNSRRSQERAHSPAGHRCTQAYH
jgi:hypothetical protein